MGNTKSKGITAVRGDVGKKLAFEICAVTGDVKNVADTPKDSVIVRVVFHDTMSATTPPISLENLIRPNLIAGSNVCFSIAFLIKQAHLTSRCLCFHRTSFPSPTLIGRRHSGGLRALRCGLRKLTYRTRTPRSGTLPGSNTTTQRKLCSGTARRSSCATAGRAPPPGSTFTSRCSGGSIRENTILCST